MVDPWDEIAAGWDDDPIVQAYAAAAFGSLKIALENLGIDLRGARVCDFGCGTGQLVQRLADTVEAIDAVDTSAQMRAALDRKIAERGWAHVMTAAHPPPDGRYDLIVCSSVCAFLDDYPGTVAQLAGQLVPGGVFVQWDWALDPTADEPMGLTAEAIDAALTAAGLQVISVAVGFEATFEGNVMAPLMGVGRR